LADEITSQFYEQEAAAYTSRGEVASQLRLKAFLSKLPKGGSVLELGCGAGQDSEAMIAAGYDVTPTDGTPAIATAAEQRLGRKVEILPFDAIWQVACFDGVWAHACLLHLPRAELPSVFAKIHRALKPGGLFYASFKAGSAEGRDGFGRFFNYLSPENVHAAYDAAAVPWSAVDIAEDQSSGYDQQPTRWLHVTATKAT
jgi:SAM-dependent methyltransferase